MTPDPNPYAVRSTLEAGTLKPLPPSGAKPRIWIDVCFVLLLGLIAVAGGISATRQIYTIIPSGITLTVAGLALVTRELLARRTRTRWHTGLILGASGPLISLFVFGLIALNGWGPGDARRHGVPQLCLCFSVAICIFLVFVFRELRTRRSHLAEPRTDGS